MENIVSRITINQNICNGKPCIRNMRFTVTQLLELMASGMNESEILSTYAFLEIEDIRACLLYASRITNSNLKMIFCSFKNN